MNVLWTMHMGEGRQLLYGVWSYSLLEFLLLRHMLLIVVDCLVGCGETCDEETRLMGIPPVKTA